MFTSEPPLISYVHGCDPHTDLFFSTCPVCQQVFVKADDPRMLRPADDRHVCDELRAIERGFAAPKPR